DDRRVAAEQRGRHRTAALERHDHEIEAEGELEHLDRQRRRGAGAGRSDAVLTGLALENLDKLLDRLRRELGIDDPGVRRGAGLRYRDEVLVDDIGNTAVEARVDHDARGREQDGIAVARRTPRVAHAEIAARARNI